MITRRYFALALAALTSLGFAAPLAAGAAAPRPAVAVIDFTGFDATNPAFAANVVDEVCLDALAGQPGGQAYCPNHAAIDEGPGAAAPQTTTGGNYAFPGSWHGTAVASVVSGTLGVSPNTPLVLIRNLYSTDSALQWVAAHAAQYDIVAAVMSAGVFTTDPSVRGYVPCAQQTDTVGSRQISLIPDITALAQAGVAFVAAAGNDSSTQYIEYPACLPGVVSVGAVVGGAVAAFSDVSTGLSLLAPGDVPVAYEPTLGSSSATVQYGTSFAAPAVAGAIAELRAADPSLSVDQEVALLRATGQPLNDSVVHAIPALNLPAALAYLSSGQAIVSLASTFTTQSASAPAPTSTPAPSGTATKPPTTTPNPSTPNPAAPSTASLIHEITVLEHQLAALRHEVAVLRHRHRP